MPNGGEVPMGDTTADIEKGYYYVSTYTPDGYAEVTSGAAHTDNKYNNVIFNKTMFINKIDGSNQSYEFDILKITFPKKILYTNGKLSKDKKTVTFEYNDYKKGDILYAVTTKKAALKANVGSIKLTGIDALGYIRKAKTLKVKTDNEIKYIKVNGKKQKSTKIKIKKEGKYKVEVKTNKNKANFEFCYDKTKPTVKVEEFIEKAHSEWYNGVEHEYPDTKRYRVTFTDENSGIKYARCASGTRIENGYVLPNVIGTGTNYIEVYDNAGNRKVVKFKYVDGVLVKIIGASN